jgi:hypothetical protein
MLLKIGAVLAAIPLSLVAVVAGTGVVVVDVTQAGPDGHHFIVPVPLVLAETASAFVPEKGRHLDLHKSEPYLPAAEAALAALADSADGELVSVEERDQHVHILKKGRNLEVHVSEPGQNVDVTVPLEMATSLLRQARHGEITPATLVGLLGRARLTTLADVRSGDDHVRVSVW